MQLKRLIKSFINLFGFFLCINFILWIFNIRTIGELATGITTGKNRKENFFYFMGYIIQDIVFITIIGAIVCFYFWVTDKPSIAELVSGVRQKVN